MRIGDVFEIVPTCGFIIEEKWVGSFLILERILTHQIADKIFTMYYFRTHRRSENSVEELIHTTWIFDSREVKDLLKKVKKHEDKNKSI